MIINPTTVNETRFSYEYRSRESLGDNSIPAISVGSAFVGGGATIGDSFNKGGNWEVQKLYHHHLWQEGAALVKFGLVFAATGTPTVRKTISADRSPFRYPERRILQVAFLRASSTTPPSPICTEIIPAVPGLDQYRSTILQTIDPRYLFIRISF
jgi:hypothetical protein